MEKKSNQFLGEECIGRLMRKYAIPCIISLLVNTLTGKGSLEEVRLSISLALIQSMPVPDEGDDGNDGGMTARRI